jgi:DNA helicase-2/ATP-dependent DNA helicase PcrA
MLEPAQMEEERRLMYVGITRAMERVYLLFTGERSIFGSTQINPPSRFLDDIPEHLVESHNMKHETRNNEATSTNDNADVSRCVLRATCFKDGDRVHHEIFGDGMIVATQGDIITVAFSKAGLKKLSVNIAPLKKI